MRVIGVTSQYTTSGYKIYFYEEYAIKNFTYKSDAYPSGTSINFRQAPLPKLHPRTQRPSNTSAQTPDQIRKVHLNVTGRSNKHTTNPNTDPEHELWFSTEINT